jgi:hypothetical protein
MNSHLNEVAHGVAVHYGELSGDTQAAFDPSMILVIIELAGTIFELFQDCGKTEEEALSAIREPSRWEGLMLRIHVRRSLGRKDYRRHGRQMVEALKKQGSDMDAIDVQRIYAEI